MVSNVSKQNIIIIKLIIVYIGGITSMLGLTLAGVSIPKILVFLLLVGCQVYRALQEEKLLTTAFPEYADYAAKTARFLPGLF